MRVRKPRFAESAPNLPKTFGLYERVNAARVLAESPEKRAAERKHDAEPPRGEHRVVSPNHGKKFCLFQNFFRELQSGFPSLSRKSQHLFCEICAKSGITRARKTTLFRCAPQFVANLRLFQERGSRGIFIISVPQKMPRLGKPGRRAKGERRGFPYPSRLFLSSA